MNIAQVLVDTVVCALTYLIIFLNADIALAIAANQFSCHNNLPSVCFHVEQ